MDMVTVMEHSLYAVPVSIVLLCVILVFTFGFKKAEQPPFAQLSAHVDMDKKVASKKRVKTKEKKAVNGFLSNEKTSPVKKNVLTKTDVPKKNNVKINESEDALKEPKHDGNKTSAPTKREKIVNNKVSEENKVEHVKNKKNLKNLYQEKPVDYDDGDWEQAYSRKDKKNKKKEEETPLKKNKKTKKADLINEAVAKRKEAEKSEIKDKTAKETENKELKEKDEKEIILEPISNQEPVKGENIQKQEEVKKTEKIIKEDKKNQKSKKSSQKSLEAENVISTNPLSTPKSDNHIKSEKIESNKEELEELDNSEKHNLEQQSQEKIAPVFDELGDVWMEAKPQKKSKKKARKDN